MMTPAAAPMILTFATIHRRRTAEGRPTVPTAIFVLGYLVVWTIYSVVAAVAQAGLHAAALLSPAMAATSPLLAGGLLVAAGVFQWTPLKHACLSACRSPLSFLMTGWREGRGGAFVMGLRHGLYCLGCCWALMALLFVAGVMNLLWVAAIAVAVLVEKVVPRGDLVGRLASVALVAAGVWLVARGVMG
jgi:predicted metal-binding membrane protein